MLLASGPESWATFAKFLVGLGVGLLVVSGGLFMIAWSVAQKARSQWLALAGEWSKSDDFRKCLSAFCEQWSKSNDFRDAINAARKELTDRLIQEMHAEIDKRIATHNSRDNLDAHRAAIGHAIRNMMADIIGKYGFERQIEDLEARVEKLEKG